MDGGNLDIVEFLVSTDPKLLNSRDADGQTPLTWAAWKGHLDIVKFLLNIESDIDITLHEDERGHTAFMLAILRGHLNVVRVFANNDKVDIYRPNSNGVTPFEIAVLEEDLDIVEFFLSIESDIDINLFEDESGYTLFMYAILAGHLDVVRVFANNDKVDIYRPNSNGVTPFEIAVLTGSLDIIEFLVGINAELLNLRGTLSSWIRRSE